MSTELRTTDYIPDHPRWCEETLDCADYKPAEFIIAEHQSSRVSFVPGSDDVRVSVGNTRVDTGGIHEGDLSFEVGCTEVSVTLHDSSRCDCSRSRNVTVRLDRKGVTELINLLTVHADLALARQLLDLEQFPS